MSHPVEVARFQLQVIRGYKRGLAEAQKKVRFYEGLLKSVTIDDSQKESLKIYISIHKHEVTVFKELLASALRKLQK